MDSTTAEASLDSFFSSETFTKPSEILKSSLSSDPPSTNYTSGGGHAGEKANFLSNATNAVNSAFTSSFTSYVTNQGLSNAKQQASEQWHQHFGSLQGWKLFLWPMRCNCKGGLSAAKENIVHFQTNYSFLFLGYLCFSLIFNPSSLVTICVLALSWVLFLRKNDDPEWKMMIAGIPIGPTQRWVLMCVISIIAILVFIGQIIFSACVVFAIVALLHSCMHIPPSEQEGASSNTFQFSGHDQPEMV